MDMKLEVAEIPIVTPDSSSAYPLTSSSSPSGISGDEMSDCSSMIAGGISADNYLTITEGCQTVLGVEELTECVNRCKELVLESLECSEERKWLVRRLIELRLRLQQAVEMSVGDFIPEQECVILGHHFTLKYEPASTSKKYCDKCTGTIWHLVQSWYECKDCQYKSHVTCLSSTVRVCAHLILSEKPFFESKICPDLGLSAQGYACAECHSHIYFSVPKAGYTISIPFSLAPSFAEARRCDYSGEYYCPSCHWNSMSVIPARVINNWDFTQRPVSRAGYHIIKAARSRPNITLDPRLYDLIEELATIKAKRIELSLMKTYISTCRVALESGFLMRELEWRRHLLHSSEIFSLNDLMDVHSGKLVNEIEKIHSTLIKHITIECELCRGRGHICLQCYDKTPLFPFDPTSFICPKCSYVQHKVCWVNKQFCPKCQLKFKRLLKDADAEMS